MKQALAAAVPQGSTTNASPLIVAHGLCKTYGAGDANTVALKELDFTIYDGEFVSVVGQSGCGKSTLLKILAGLLPFTAGTVELTAFRCAVPARKPRSSSSRRSCCHGEPCLKMCSCRSNSADCRDRSIVRARSTCWQ